MRRLVLNIMFISNTTDGNTNNDINESVNNNISSADDSNKTRLYIIASIVTVFILGIIICVLTRKRTNTPEVEEKHRTVNQLGSLASGDGDLDKKQEDMEKEEQQQEEQKEEIGKLKGLLKELKELLKKLNKDSEVICEKKNGQWKIKTEPLKEGFVEEVQKKVIEIIDIMTQIKMNDELLIDWLKRETDPLYIQMDIKELRGQIVNKITNYFNTKDFLILSSNKKESNKKDGDTFDIKYTIKNSSGDHEYTIATYTQEEYQRIEAMLLKPYPMLPFNQNNRKVAIDNKELICGFYQKCYEFFSKNSAEIPGQAEFWTQFKEKVLDETGKEQDRASYMLLTQNSAVVAGFLTPMMLERLEKKLDDLKNELEQK